MISCIKAKFALSINEIKKLTNHKIKFNIKDIFQAYVTDLKLFNKNTKLLLASSGGVDSAVLFDLLHKCGYDFVVAHFNFKLRGLESDTDELFIKKICKKHQIPFYTENAATADYANAKGISIQMAARELRYQWFEKLRITNKYELILTAHHQDDNLETILLNITKGTGLKGLRGILPKNGLIIRPLLCFDKEQIIEYAYNNNLTWRDDASNESTKYERNKIRHEVVPILKQINKTVLNQLKKNSQYLAETESIYNFGLEKIKQEIIVNNEEEQFISIRKLLKYKGYFTVLYEILSPLGYNADQVKQLIKAFNSESGKKFLSETHQVIKDRKHIIIAPIKYHNKTYHLIEMNQKQVLLEKANLTINYLNRKTAFEKEEFAAFIPKDNFTAKIHFNKLEFPLKLRKWKQGDYFYPFGMKRKKKKVSEFFKNIKLNLIEKDKVWILEDNKKRIVWIIGHRIDDRFAIHTTTRKILEMDFVKNL